MKKMKLCLPVGWRMIKARYLFRFSRGYTIGRADMGDTGVACIHYGDIHGDYHFAIDINTARLGRIDEPLRFGVSEYVGAGQFLFAGSSEDYEGSGNFTLIRGNRSAIAGTDTIVLTPYSDMDVDYTAYLFDSLFFREQIRPHMMGTKVFHPSQKVIKSAWCIVPPQNESRQIVQYLNRETLWIDGVIEKLRREVELLEQYRRELIARTVTRGLDPDVPMRDSGIEWMPQIPSHWAVLQGKRVFTKLQRPVREGSETITCFRDGTVTLRRNRRSEGFTESLQEIGYQGVEPGDLVIHEMDAFAGAIGVSDSYGKSTPVYAVCAIQNNGDPHFYAYLLRQMAQSDFILSLAKGIRQRTVDFRFKTLASLLVAVPPSSEQKQIANFLDGRMLEIDSTIFGINKQIELLNRYRKQVINDAVTGKIRVGKVA